MKLAISAGFDKSLPALLLADGLRRCGHEVCAILVVSPFTARRVRSLLFREGVSGLRRASRKLVRGTEPTASENPLEEMAEICGLRERTLKAWCARHAATYYTLSDINSPEAAAALLKHDVQGLIYAGGGILRRKLLDAVGGVAINPHSGPLPQVRGMNAIEWAVLLDQPAEITIHFIDQGIDTGKVLRRASLTKPLPNDVGVLRAMAVAAGIESVIQLLDGVDDPVELNTENNIGAQAGRQCFTLAPALYELLELKLDRDTRAQ